MTIPVPRISCGAQAPSRSANSPSASESETMRRNCLKKHGAHRKNDNAPHIRLDDGSISVVIEIVVSVEAAGTLIGDPQGDGSDALEAFGNLESQRPG